MAGTSVPMAAHQEGYVAPCPLHGDIQAHLAAETGAPPHNKENGNPGSGSNDASCYCSTFCHASAALPNITMSRGPHGHPLQAGERVIVAHTYEPSPLPRPPKIVASPL